MQQIIDTAFAPATWSNWVLAVFALVAALLALRTLGAINRQADIAERTVTEGREPHLAATDLKLIRISVNDLTTLGVAYRLTNYGLGPAVVGHSAVICEYREALKQPPAYAGALLQWANIGQVLAVNDSSEALEVWSKLTLEADTEYKLFLRGDGGPERLFLYGEVFYDDLFGNGYVSGFAAIWDHERQRMRLASDEEAKGYNYKHTFRGGSARAYASIWRRIYRRLFK